jgi:hypothetical protein
MISITSTVDRGIDRMFDRTTGAAFLNMLRRQVRARAKPALAAAKAATPVKSGRLQASLTIFGHQTPSQGLISAVIRPRDDFTYTSRGGIRSLVVGSKTSAKRIAKMRKRGGRIETGNQPWIYARLIEEGLFPDGTRRRTGGAHMLQKGMRSGADAFMTGIAKDAFAFTARASG